MAESSANNAAKEGVLSDGKNTTSPIISEHFCGIPSVLPPEILTLNEVASLLGYASLVSEACEAKNLPARKATTLPKYEILEGFVEKPDTTVPSPSQSPSQVPRGSKSHSACASDWSAEAPYSACLSNARWLTPEASSLQSIRGRRSTWGCERRVVHIDINLGDSKISYAPGDSIGIMVPNPAYLVAAVCAQTAEAQARRASSSSSSSGGGEGGAACGDDSDDGGSAPSLLASSLTALEVGAGAEAEAKTTVKAAAVAAISTGPGAAPIAAAARAALIDCDILLNGVTTTVRETLTYTFDLTSSPRKNSVFALSSYCADVAEQRRMQWLCSKCAVGRALWRHLVEEQCLGLGELILLFPTCSPPLGGVLANATRSVPRYYSAASSPLKCTRSHQISIAFSLVHYNCGVSLAHSCDSPASEKKGGDGCGSDGGSGSGAGTPVANGVFGFDTSSSSGGTSSSSSSSSSSGGGGQRRPLIQRAGVCTSYLEWSARGWLYAKTPEMLGDPASHTYASRARARQPQVRIFHKSAPNFRLPGSVAPPLILIGPGTGVAPFVGFLEHRHALEQVRRKHFDDACEGVWRGGFEIEEEDLPGEANSVDRFISETNPGAVHLFFGCRSEHDFLFRAQLQQFLADRTLSSLDVAMSRVQEQKVYVTHKLRARGAEIARLVLNEGAYIYVCGDGNCMAKDVNATLLDIFAAHGEMGEAEAADLIATLKIKRRYSQDIWS